MAPLAIVTAFAADGPALLLRYIIHVHVGTTVFVAENEREYQQWATALAQWWQGPGGGGAAAAAAGGY